MAQKNAPILFPAEPESDAPDPAQAPVIEDQTAPKSELSLNPAPERSSRLLSWILALATLIVSIVIGTALWDFAVSLFAQNTVLGWAFSGLTGALGCLLLIAMWREIRGYFHLSSLENVRKSVTEAYAQDDMEATRQAVEKIAHIYAKRREGQWSHARFEQDIKDQFEAEALIILTEKTLLQDLDAKALQEVEQAARQITLVTALVPMALADMISSLYINVRMIRRVAEIYGARGGVLGSLRLLRNVSAHMIATGAIATGEDWLSTVLGGGLFSKLSRRFGEGLVNAALTARIGRTAIEICRPAPFVAAPRPATSTIVKNALSGLFSTKASA